MGRRSKAVDWLEIERRYILGDSCRAISRDHDISHVAILNRAKKHGWQVNKQLAELPDAVKLTQTAKIHALPENSAQKKQIALGIASPETATAILSYVERGIFPYTAARRLGLSRRTFEAWLERDVEFSGMLRAADARANSEVEQAIHGVSIQGDARAGQQYLSAKERKQWADKASGGQSAGIQVIVNVSRDDPHQQVDIQPEIIDIVPND